VTALDANAPLRLVFMGTAEFSCASLAALLADARIQVVGVVTQPDKPKGRDMKLQPPPVKVLAEQHRLPIWQPLRAREESFIAEMRALRPDLAVVVAYGQILPQALLDIPRHGCLNVHGSLLPQYRGAAPIQRAIANGEAETGVAIMKMDAGMDTGPVLAMRATPIAPADDAVTLYERLARMGAKLLLEIIPGWVAGTVPARPQPTEGVSHAAKIRKEDGRVDWTQPATVIWNRLRAFTPWPGAFTFLPSAGGPQLLKIWKVEVLPAGGAPGEILAAEKSGLVVGCGAGAIRILELQREGGRRQPAEQFLAGSPLRAGMRLG